MPVDPWGSGLYYANDTYDDQGYTYPYEPSWWDLARQAIREGAETAQIVASGYPPGSTVVYAPQYPGGPAVPVVQAPPPSYPSPVGPMQPLSTPQPSGAGINLSNTTLMLLVGGFLLFSLGSKRGR